MLSASLCNKPTLIVANKLDVTSTSSTEPGPPLPYSEEGAQGSITGPATPASFLAHNSAQVSSSGDPSSACSTAGVPDLKVGQGSGRDAAADSIRSPAAGPEGPMAAQNGLGNRPGQIQWISCRTREGLPALEQQLERAVAHVINGNNAHLAPPLMTRSDIVLITRGSRRPVSCHIELVFRNVW